MIDKMNRTFEKREPTSENRVNPGHPVHTAPFCSSIAWNTAFEEFLADNRMFTVDFTNRKIKR